MMGVVVCKIYRGRQQWIQQREKQRGSGGSAGDGEDPGRGCGR